MPSTHLSFPKYCGEKTTFFNFCRNHKHLEVSSGFIFSWIQSDKSSCGGQNCLSHQVPKSFFFPSTLLSSDIFVLQSDVLRFLLKHLRKWRVLDNRCTITLNNPPQTHTHAWQAQHDKNVWVPVLGFVYVGTLWNPAGAADVGLWQSCNWFCCQSCQFSGLMSVHVF